MNVAIITDPEQIDRNAWSDFILAHPCGSVFQTPEMFDVFRQTLNYEPIFVCCVTEPSKKILGISLSTLIRESKGLKGMLTSRAVTWAGPLVDETAPEEVLQLLLKTHTRLAKKSAIFSQFRNYSVQPERVMKAFSSEGFVFEPHLNIVKQLPDSAETLWGELKKSRRRGINKARSNDFLFGIEESPSVIEEFHRLHDELYSRIGLPIADKTFYSSMRSTLYPEKIRIFSLKKNGENIIIMVAFVFRDTLYGFSVGVKQDEEILKLRPVDLFYYEVMKWAIENRFRYFDWGGAGSPDEDYGVRDFKLEYGGQTENMGRYMKTFNPLLLRIGKTGFYFYKMIRQRFHKNKK